MKKLSFDGEKTEMPRLSKCNAWLMQMNAWLMRARELNGQTRQAAALNENFCSQALPPAAINP